MQGAAGPRSVSNADRRWGRTIIPWSSPWRRLRRPERGVQRPAPPIVTLVESLATPVELVLRCVDPSHRPVMRRVELGEFGLELGDLADLRLGRPLGLRPLHGLQLGELAARPGGPAQHLAGAAERGLHQCGIVRLVGGAFLEDVLANAPGGKRLGARTRRHDVVGKPIGRDEDLEARRHDPAFLNRPPQASAATFMETITPGSRGGSPFGRASTFSMPSVTSPQTVYWPSRKRASSKQMKNWLLAEFGLAVRAIEQAPRTCGALENSAGRFGRSDPPLPVPVGSPPWAMKPGITRWK